MKAYVLHNNGLELMWSWDDPEAQPSSEAPAGAVPETADASTPNALTSETIPANGERAMAADLRALDGAVRIKQDADAAVIGAVRQQSEEILELREQVGRAEIEAASWRAQIQAYQSRLDTLAGQVQVILSRMDGKPDSAQLGMLESRVEELSRRLDAASNQVVPKEPEDAAAKVNDPPASGRKWGSFWKTLTEMALGVALCGGMILASWWAYTQRGKIDAFRDPDPLPILKAKIPVPELTEAPKVVEVAPAASPGVRVAITANEQIWLKVEADGKEIFAKLLPANQTKSFDASRQIRIVTGNLAGVNVNYNGRFIGPLGNSRRVGSFTFTPQGWGPTRRAAME